MTITRHTHPMWLVRIIIALAVSTGALGNIPDVPISNATHHIEHTWSLCQRLHGGEVKCEMAQQQQDSSQFGGQAGAHGGFDRKDYEIVLQLNWKFYDAQRSGKLPSKYDIPWRQSAHEHDRVPGGWYDAGDYLKLGFPLAYTVTMLSWGLLEFDKGYKMAGEYDHAKETLKTAADYLMRCRISKTDYVGQIGDPDIDHAYWGRAHEQKTKRPVYIYTKHMKSSDLLGKVAAALASSSLVFKSDDSKFADDLLQAAKDLYALGKVNPGKYSDHYKSATNIYKSSDWEDDMSWGAAWLYLATEDSKYLDEASKYWSSKYWDMTVGWDNSGAATAIMLYNIDQQKGVDVPHITQITHYVEDQFLPAWINSNGKFEIVKTKKGLSRPSWSSWGNLQLSTTAAYLALVFAKHSDNSKLAGKAEDWAKSQVDYALGSSGRSYVVGFGKNYPLRPHHAGASCPDEPRSCGWSNFESKGPNPQILFGALVGGPSGPSDSSYHDSRDDYVTNEVSNNYNAGFAGALTALVEMTK